MITLIIALAMKTDFGLELILGTLNGLRREPPVIVSGLR